MHGAMPVPVQPIVKLLNHQLLLTISGELVAVLGVTAESGLAGRFIDDGILFHPL